MDPIARFKEGQRVAWAGFAALERITGTAAPRLVSFAGVRPGAKLLDVGCGTGVVALTAARAGARATGLDLTPELVARARENAAIAGVDVDWREGDAEALPFDDASFDVVVSQFGHMFAPRPEVVTREMLRVLRPGGTIAFATWPPELCVGRMFALVAAHSPPPPPGVPPSTSWGDPAVVRERLGGGVREVTFDRAMMRFPMLSPQHFRIFIEENVGPFTRVVKTLEGEASKLASFRRELEQIAAVYFEDNVVRQDFLLTRAVKA
ncbi:MAG: class I SAM-dependent methyltransferase [Labilithrix sp.]|nr:class I SAM-dependent methyltransferase [Labilithrix sp.]